MKNMKPVLLLLLALLLSSQAIAKVETHNFVSPQIEKDYKILIAELRCLVCQNQNLADSNAELAKDMRMRVYTMLNEGSSRQQIVDFMVTRYGDFVMYRPPVKSSTYLLWYGPLLFFALAFVVVASYMRRQKPQDEVLTDKNQQKKAHSLLDE